MGTSLNWGADCLYYNYADLAEIVGCTVGVWPIIAYYVF